MHVCREANLASSSSWMYIAYIALLVDLISPLCWFLLLTKRGRTLFCVYFNPFVDDWQKGGESFWVYICIFELFAYIEFMHLMFYKMGIEFIYAYLSFFAYIEFMHLMFYKMGKCFWKFKQKGWEKFLEKGFWTYVLFLTLLMHICLFSFMYFIVIFYLLLLCMS